MTRSETSPQRVVSVEAPLKVFNDAGVFAAADVHVARRVAALSGEPVTDHELIATALAVRAVRHGSTCVELDRIGEITADPDEVADDGPVELPWPDPADLATSLRSSPLVTGCASGPLRPLALADSSDGPLLYLRKYFRQEQSIRTILDERAATRPDVDPAALTAALDEAFGPTSSDEYDRQRTAGTLAATSWTTVLAGGPGTGKTYTVARILAVMERLLGRDVRIGLCAPTGRAAAQLQAAIDEYRGTGALSVEPKAVTVHRLLGSFPDGTFRRGRDNRLPFDVVVVDETSMLAVSMMSRLLESLRADTRFILVGDPHQLASVDAGAVLADLTDRTDGAETGSPVFAQAADPAGGDFTEDEQAALHRGVITLTRGHRYGGQIGRVAEAINAGDADRVLEIIAEGGDEHGRVELIDPSDDAVVRTAVLDWLDGMRAAARAGQATEALTALGTHRVLCAHREGPAGVGGWSRSITGWLAERSGSSFNPYERYAGEPLLVNKNDPAIGVYNGDSGVVVADGEDGLTVAFGRGSQVRTIHPSRLADTSTVYAMTIHRSQGSQFSGVTVVLPDAGSELLTRELLYTAVTRAQDVVYIVGTADELRAAVDRRVRRASGLRSPVTEVPARPRDAVQQVGAEAINPEASPETINAAPLHPEPDPDADTPPY